MESQEKEIILYPPTDLLNSCTKVPKLPSNVDAISSQDLADSVFTSFLDVISKLLSHNDNNIRQFKTDARDFGLSVISATKYFQRLLVNFSNDAITVLRIVPCMLQLQPEAKKRRDLLAVATEYLIENDFKLKMQLINLRGEKPPPTAIETPNEAKPVASGCLFGLDKKPFQLARQSESDSLFGDDGEVLSDGSISSDDDFYVRDFNDDDDDDANSSLFDSDDEMKAPASLLSSEFIAPDDDHPTNDDVVLTSEELFRNTAGTPVEHKQSSPQPSKHHNIANDDDTVSLVSGSVPFMTGSLNVSIFDSTEELEEESGKFYTEYKIKCTWKETEESTRRVANWIVGRRYREFTTMDLLIREAHPNMLRNFPPLPGKRYVGSSLSSSFVDKRQANLGRYVSDLISFFPSLVQDPTVDWFLELKCNVMRYTRRRIHRETRRHGSARRIIEDRIQLLDDCQEDGGAKVLDASEFLAIEAAVDTLDGCLSQVDMDTVMEHPVLNKSLLKCIQERPRLRATAFATDLEKLCKLAQECDAKLDGLIKSYQGLLEKSLCNG